MKQLFEEAIKILQSQKVSFVLLAENRTLHTSEAIGIKPLMVLLRENKAAFEHQVIADKVIGKAAALMAVLGKASAVYGEVMSEPGRAVLETYKIPYRYGELVPFITNRQKDGKCPMEEAVWEIDSPGQAFVALEETIHLLMQQSE